MATLEEKILDGPTVEYCENGPEDERPRSDKEDDPVEKANDSEDDELPSYRGLMNRARPWTGVAANTGPKGVLNDYNRRHRRPSTSSSSDDEDWRPGACKNRPKTSSQFGQITTLSSRDEFYDTIIQTGHAIIALVHTNNSQLSHEFNECFARVALQYPHIQFVSIDAAVAGLSDNFQVSGTPAILVYNDGKLSDTLLKINEDIGNTPEVDEVVDYLVMKQILPSSFI